MVREARLDTAAGRILSVLALSSRFDGPQHWKKDNCIVRLSVLALSSRFDGHARMSRKKRMPLPFSTRSVESF